MKNTADLFSTGQPVGQLLQAAHHPLVPEVVREGFRPLRQQLEDLRGDLPHSHLEEEDQDQTNKQVRKPSLNQCVCGCVGVWWFRERTLSACGSPSRCCSVHSRHTFDMSSCGRMKRRELSRKVKMNVLCGKRGNTASGDRRIVQKFERTSSESMKRSLKKEALRRNKVVLKQTNPKHQHIQGKEEGEGESHRSY